MARCPNCGKEVGEGMAFCPSCGSKLTVDKEFLKIKIDELRHNEKIAWSVVIFSFIGAVMIIVLGSWLEVGRYLGLWAVQALFIIIIMLAIVGAILGAYALYLSYKRSKLIEYI